MLLRRERRCRSRTRGAVETTNHRSEAVVGATRAMARSGHPEVSWSIVLEAVLWKPFRRGPGATTVGDASMLTLRGRRADFDRTDLDALLESVAQELAGAGGR